MTRKGTTIRRPDVSGSATPGRLPHFPERAEAEQRMEDKMTVGVVNGGGGTVRWHVRGWGWQRVAGLRCACRSSLRLFASQSTVLTCARRW
jgi:hypothetical protein